MRKNLKSIKKKRSYSEDFKKQLVEEFETGKFSVPELEKLHQISNSSIYSWIYKYSNFNSKGYRIVENKTSSTKKIKELEQQIKDLEAMVGRKQIKIDYLETMMQLAKQELDIDIKKNFFTPQSQERKNELLFE